VQFQPSTKVLLNPQDSIAFSDGRKIPYIINDVILMAPSDRIPDWMKWVFVVLAPLQLVLIILIIWKLIRFIINVSKEQIFVSRNVRYLRQVSTFLLIIALIQICEGLCKSKIFSIYELTTSGYNLSSTWDFSWNLLIMATLGFLFAQIWSYGIQIKEDQELTI
ncbi:MAG: DUF2975 domain-containing protein, partial [Muribaculaceae bacterium]|nr:DUF2975 domain-containing protein [Muribaculaceae bacterium]